MVALLEQETGHTFQNTTINSQLIQQNLHPYYTYLCSVTAVTVGSGPAATVTIQMPEDG